MQLQLESLKALILGGIAFDTPQIADEQRDEAQLRSPAGHEFPLYADQDEAESAAFGRRVPLVSYFDSSVAGLTAGADVTLHGLKIGTVTSVDLKYDQATDSILVPVHYTGRAAAHPRRADEAREHDRGEHRRAGQARAARAASIPPAC